MESNLIGGSRWKSIVCFHSGLPQRFGAIAEFQRPSYSRWSKWAVERFRLGLKEHLLAMVQEDFLWAFLGLCY